jgi:hypothetical protein
MYFLLACCRKRKETLETDGGTHSTDMEYYEHYFDDDEIFFDKGDSDDELPLQSR